MGGREGGRLVIHMTGQLKDWKQALEEKSGLLPPEAHTPALGSQ